MAQMAALPAAVRPPAAPPSAAGSDGGGGSAAGEGTVKLRGWWMLLR